MCLSGADTGGAYCLLEVSLAPGIGVPRHTHTREDETYYVPSGELEVVVGEEIFVLKNGDSLMAPRNIAHQLRNSGSTTNHSAGWSFGEQHHLPQTAVCGPPNGVMSCAQLDDVGVLDEGLARQTSTSVSSREGFIARSDSRTDPYSLWSAKTPATRNSSM